MTRSDLYRFLITEQARIQAALDEIDQGPAIDVHSLIQLFRLV